MDEEYATLVFRGTWVLVSHLRALTLSCANEISPLNIIRMAKSIDIVHVVACNFPQQNGVDYQEISLIV